MSFRLFGVRTYINFYFLVAVSLLLMIDRSGVVALCIASSILHEIGHLAALTIIKATPKEISFGPSGIKLFESRQGDISYTKDIFVAISGPIVNFAAFAVLYILSIKYKNSLQPISAMIPLAALVNLVIGIFNLLPIAPLDGGRVVYSLLCSLASQETATRVIKVLSITMLLPVATFGFYLLIKSGYNVTLLFTSIYLAYLLMESEL